MSSEILKKLYYQSCCEELTAFKPGNHSIFSKIHGMSEKKFRYAAKISSEIITNKNLSFGESIFLSTKRCKTELNSNYNLGIIILCTPLIRVSLSGTNNFKRDLEKLLSNVSKKDGELFTKAIEFASPAGLKNYKGPGNIFGKKKISFSKMIKISSEWDRISKCYNNNYKEIFDFGLPIFTYLLRCTSRKVAIEILYISFLSKSTDSHIQRKFGQYKANIVLKKCCELKKKLNMYKNNYSLLKNFDHYLKKFNYNPGTCADLTVTTLLIHKIRDIFKFPL